LINIYFINESVQPDDKNKNFGKIVQEA